LRKLVIATALIVLAAATTAYAAIATDSGSISYSSKKAGTPAKPVPLGYTIQLDVKLKLYGMKFDGKDFPTCSATKIAAAHNDTVCPKGALIASGFIHSLLGSATNFNAAQAPGFACDPLLHVWNSGQGKQTYFFLTDATHQCGGLKTGSTPPYPGTSKEVGKYVMSDVPIPKYIDYPVAGLVGSLEYEHLVFKAHTTKVHGKTVSSISAFGCLHGKRPYTITSTTTLPGQGKEVDNVKGSPRCS
jgi:hypothetical protein